MKKIVTIFLTLVAFTTSTRAQSLKKIDNLLNQKDYSKAITELLKIESKSQEVLEKLGDAYYNTKDMPEAKKWYGILVKKYEKNVSIDYLYKYNQTLRSTGDYTTADIYFQKATGKKVNTNEYFKNLKNNSITSSKIEKITTNSTTSDFAPSFYGDSLVFASSRGNGKIYKWNNQPYLDLYVGAIEQNGDIQSAKAFSKSLNSDIHESNATFSKDGKTVYFTRNNNDNGKRIKDENKITQLKVYKATLTNGIWGNITELPFNGDNYSIAHPSLSADGKQLYFASDMPGTLGSTDIYVVSINADGTYGKPSNLGTIINTNKAEQFPFISDDNTLYFASEGLLGLGGLDIFKSKSTNGTFETPQNLGDVINSSADDFSFIINGTKTLGYFASNREGSLVDNIYRFSNTITKSFISGTIVDSSTNNPVSGASINLTDSSFDVSKEITVGNDGKYSFQIKPGVTYTIVVNKEQYKENSSTFLAPEAGLKKEIALVKDVPKKPVFDPIYFDFDQSKITNSYKTSLDASVATIKANPDMNVRIEAYTDAIGTSQYNLKLSKERALAVKKYLTSKGIPAEKIEYVAHGNSMAVINCGNTDECKKASAKERKCVIELFTN
ncbi:OmpA family protein [Flavobacterium sp. NG2]|uniref:OmpA family protein n=1 Tax=Flavobacterium sp. NG2 TaxID=3097547 RepID=UPI002A7FD12D|nr:OmpA family protein [Flavobacterium sp. NG2]WPR72678.1 OmpA family protein [Flavobacterium sp. NG2]